MAQKGAMPDSALPVQNPVRFGDFQRNLAMNSQKHDPKGLFIPAFIWHSDLTLMEKCLLSKIDALYDPEIGGCWAPNEMLAELFDSTPESISVQISKLRKLGWIIDSKHLTTGERLLLVLEKGVSFLETRAWSRAIDGYKNAIASYDKIEGTFSAVEGAKIDIANALLTHLGYPRSPKEIACNKPSSTSEAK